MSIMRTLTFPGDTAPREIQDNRIEVITVDENNIASHTSTEIREMITNGKLVYLNYNSKLLIFDNLANSDSEAEEVYFSAIASYANMDIIDHSFYISLNLMVLIDIEGSVVDVSSELPIICGIPPAKNSEYNGILTNNQGFPMWSQFPVASTASAGVVKLTTDLSNVTTNGTAADAKAVKDALANVSSVTLDTTLTVEGQAADAKAVGDAIANITIDVDTTLTAEGQAADAKAVGDAINAIPIVEIDDTLSIKNKAADAQAVGDAFSNFPVSVADDGYTEIKGMRQATAINAVKVNDTITMTTTLEGGTTTTSVITLDANGFPKTVVTDELECVITFEGFELFTNT